MLLCPHTGAGSIRRPVIEIQNQKYNPAPDASLTGQLSSQSGEVIGFTHVLSTFYDRNGQLVWIAGQYSNYGDERYSTTFGDANASRAGDERGLLRGSFAVMTGGQTFT